MSKAQSVHSPEVEQINQQLQSTQSVEYTEKHLSSLVWICSSNQNKGIVMVSRVTNTEMCDIRFFLSMKIK